MYIIETNFSYGSKFIDASSDLSYIKLITKKPAVMSIIKIQYDEETLVWIMISFCLVLERLVMVTNS